MRPAWRLPSPASGYWTLCSARRECRAAAPVPVHLKVDTGLRRYGATASEAVALATRIASDPYLRLASIFTHFASADEPDEPFTAAQLQEFEQVVDAVRDAGVRLPPLHAANSAGILTDRCSNYAIARPGIALYGVPPSPEVPLLPGMRPGISIESRITRLITVAPGDTVGYNRTFRAGCADAGGIGADWVCRRLSARTLRPRLGRNRWPAERP